MNERVIGRRSVFIGIDVHKDSAVVCIFCDGEINRHEVPNRTDELVDLLASLTDFDASVCCESTRYYLPVEEACQSLGIPFHLAAPAKTGISRKKSRTDKSDAEQLARLLASGCLPTVNPVPIAYREGIKLSRLRRHIVQATTALSNQQSSYEQDSATPAIISLKHTEGVIAKDVIEHASTANPDGHGRLTTIPGIGQILAATIILETNDIARFPTDSNYISYSGLSPGHHYSASRHVGSPNTKKHNAHLKWAYGLAARRFVQTTGKQYHETLARKHGKQKAYGIIAAKLARACYVMLRDGTDFNPSKFKPP